MQTIQKDPNLKITWINQECFVDPEFLNYKKSEIPLNTLANITIDDTLRLDWLFSAWFGLQKTRDISVITADGVLSEYKNVELRRHAYKERRIAEEERPILKLARTKPGIVYDNINIDHDHKSWKACQRYTYKTRSVFNSYLAKAFPKNSIARALARKETKTLKDKTSKGSKAHLHAQALDFQLRLLSNTSLREEMSTFVKLDISHNKMAQLLKAMQPFPGDNMESYDCFLHDLNISIKHVLQIFNHVPSKILLNDLLNAITARTLPNVEVNLRKLARTPKEILKELDFEKLTSLKTCTVEVDKKGNQPFIDAFRQEGSSVGILDTERAIENSLQLGVIRDFWGLLRQRKTIPRQSLPVHTEHFLSSIDVKIYITNMATPDGWLAMAVPGICVDFAGYDHRDHFGCDAGYLTVYYKSSLVLGGFIINAGSHYLLNNLQGALPNKINDRNNKTEIAKAIVDLLSTLPLPVALKDMGFNSMSLSAAVDMKQQHLKFSLPDISLDNPSEGHFFVCGDKQSLKQKMFQIKFENEVE
ncbi:hypothetical protein [Kiloniella sp.]|uniref:hypothetical protein n=1 Tax=Kiloniella sp. TaxID=1938587 RepID=UPI003B02D458